MDHFHIALSEDQLRAVSSIGLAHVGDAVYELLVRTWLCAHGKATGKDLHRAAIALVCAPRGRNAAVHAIPKNATTAQYHQATALECLLGWLYLRGDTDRVSALFDVMMEED